MLETLVLEHHHMTKCSLIWEEINIIMRRDETRQIED